MMSPLGYYLLSAFFFLSWFIGYLVFDLGGFYHLVFLAAVVVMIVKLVSDGKNEKN